MLAAVDTRTLTFTRHIEAAPAHVYHALTNATALRQWFCDRADVEAALNRSFFLAWNIGYFTTGIFTTLKPNETVAFTWNGVSDPAPTAVHIVLEAQGSGTLVTLEHSGIGEGEAWDTTAQQYQQEWEGALENLQSALETGLDLRLMRRPMLGIYPDMLTPEMAAKLAVPVQAGIYLGGVVEGMGAKAAGLQKDDVLVGIGGQPLSDYASLHSALSPHKAGDTVEVAFYRGSTAHTVSMTLSGRPKPDVPETPAALAAKLRENAAQLDSELDTLLNGVSEAEAAHQPAPGEWSAKEVLAHLIWTERFNQLWVFATVGGNDQVPWPDNNVTQLAGLLAAHPTVGELAAELKRAEQMTAATVAAMPDNFLPRKASYLLLGQSMLGLPGHTRGHFEQMRAAIAAARQ